MHVFQKYAKGSSDPDKGIGPPPYWGMQRAETWAQAAKVLDASLRIQDRELGKRLHFWDIVANTSPLQQWP